MTLLKRKMLIHTLNIADIGRNNEVLKKGIQNFGMEFKFVLK